MQSPCVCFCSSGHPSPNLLATKISVGASTRTHTYIHTHIHRKYKLLFLDELCYVLSERAGWRLCREGTAACVCRTHRVAAGHIHPQGGGMHRYPARTIHTRPDMSAPAQRARRARSQGPWRPCGSRVASTLPSPQPHTRRRRQRRSARRHTAWAGRDRARQELGRAEGSGAKVADVRKQLHRRGKEHPQPVSLHARDRRPHTLALNCTLHGPSPLHTRISATAPPAHSARLASGVRGQAPGRKNPTAETTATNGRSHEPGTVQYRSPVPSPPLTVMPNSSRIVRGYGRGFM